MAGRNKVNIDGLTAVLRRELGKGKNRKVRDNAAAQKLKAKLVPQYEAKVGGHYLHAIEAIGDVLQDPGIGSIGQSGPKRVRYSRFGAKSRRGRFQTQAWQALNPAYAARDPRSRTFWRKGRKATGNGPEYVQLAELYARAVRAVGKPVARGMSEAITTAPGRAQLRTVFYLARLPVPLNRLIGSAFLRRKASSALTSRLRGSVARGARNSIRRIAWVEGTRPFVSGLAATLGAQMIEDLRKLEK